nr:MAG TPA: Dynamin family [Caudoviricetes sp.]
MQSHSSTPISIRTIFSINECFSNMPVSSSGKTSFKRAI